MKDEDVDGLAKEQGILDEHDDEIAALASRIQELLTTCSSASEVGVRNVLVRRLSQFRARLSAADATIGTLSDDPKEVHLVYLYQEQLADYKKELGDIRHEVNSCAPEESGEMETDVSTLDKQIFDLSLVIKRLLYHPRDLEETALLTPPTHDAKPGV